MKSQFLQRFLHLFVCIALLGNMILPVLPQSGVAAAHEQAQLPLNTAVVSVQAPTVPLTIGTQFTTTIQIDSLSTPLSAFQFDLLYDSTILQLTGVSPGDFLQSAGRTAVCPPVAAQNNRVRLACASAGDAPLATGSGILTTLAFVTLAPGSSNLTISGLQLPDGSAPPNGIAATTQFGIVTVAPQAALSLAGGPTQTAEPGMQATHALTLTNLASSSDTFTITVSGQNWVSILSDNSSGPLAGSGRFPFTLDVTIPATAVDGDQDMAMVTAVSHNDPAVTQSVTLIAQAQQTQPPPQNGHNIYLPVLMNTPGSSSTVTEPQTIRQPTTPGDTASPLALMLGQNCYLADVNCDLKVDETDLTEAAVAWNCANSDVCYASRYDLDQNNHIDVFDLAWVGNEYDITSPIITIITPPDGAIIGGTNVTVSGIVSDVHPIASVTVNDIAAAVSGNAFTVLIPVSGQTLVLDATAVDIVGQVGIASRVANVDAAGPDIQIHTPPDRQSVYSLNPTIAISYTDFLSAVDPASVHVQLTDENGSSADITADLTINAAGAFGMPVVPLNEDTAYTMTVSTLDDLGNGSSSQSTFYVPTGAGQISPPTEPPVAGWVSGFIYDSSSCNIHLTQCQGLAGVHVTISQVDTTALQRVRLERTQQLAAKGPQPPMPTDTVLKFTTPVTGTIVTGPDGFFAFPVDATAVYWLRADKVGYTYGQREAEVVLERSTATSNIFLTLLDPAITPCDDSGCVHNSSDGSLQLEIPPGAIAPGQTEDINATNFEQVEFLPSGDLPPGTWETYAYNLGGASEITFTQPITVRVQNDKGFSPGTHIPLGYWNQVTQQWEHAGTGIVDATGQWIEMTVTHFSNYDCNDPLAPLEDTDPDADDNSDDDDDDCEDGENGCFVSIRSGTFGEDVQIPSVNVLGEDVAPTLIYNSNRAYPTEVIDVDLSLNVGSSVVLSDFIGFELYIEGIKTDSLTFSSTLQTGEVGRFRYLWDGRDAQDNLLPPGLYEYGVKFIIPYRSQYCYALGGIFGNPPDCIYGATGIFVDATEDVWVNGTVELNTRVNSPYGAGWVLDGLQELYEDEAGRLLVVEGDSVTEYYAAGKDLLLEQTAALQRPAVVPQPESAGGYQPQHVTGAEEESPRPVPPHARSEWAGGYQPQHVTELEEEVLRPVPPQSQPEMVNQDRDEPAPPPTPMPAFEAPEVPEGTELPPTAVPDPNAATLPTELPPLPSAPPADATEPEALPELPTDALNLESDSQDEAAAESLPIPVTAPVDDTASNEFVQTPATDVSGTIITDTTWTAAGSPYVVVGNVTVADGVHLTIEPGVTVIFNQYRYMYVNGRLTAVGTPTTPITFTAAVSNTSGYWGYLQIGGGSNIDDSDVSQ
ncbi:MAG: hypothetical protein GY796_11570, partial [Chloroflexi bacterium]|nr:hypothetical protein [Chloroflexota bacterium]